MAKYFCLIKCRCLIMIYIPRWRYKRECMCDSILYHQWKTVSYYLHLIVVASVCLWKWSLTGSSYHLTISWNIRKLWVIVVNTLWDQLFFEIDLYGDSIVQFWYTYIIYIIHLFILISDWLCPEVVPVVFVAFE